MPGKAASRYEPRGTCQRFTTEQQEWLEPLLVLAEHKRRQTKEPDVSRKLACLHRAVLRIAKIADLDEQERGRKDAARIAKLFDKPHYDGIGIEMMAGCLQKMAERKDGPRLSRWLDIIERCQDPSMRSSLIIEIGKTVSMLPDSREVHMTYEYLKGADPERVATLLAIRNRGYYASRVLVPPVPRTFTYLHDNEKGLVFELSRDITTRVGAVMPRGLSIERILKTEREFEELGWDRSPEMPPAGIVLR